MFRVKLISAMLLAFVALCAAPRAWAQGTTGQISGVVTDPNGARVASAMVKVTSLETAAVREATAGSEGEFIVPLLPPGRYKVEVNATGFGVYTTETVVNITQTTALAVSLSIGGGGPITVDVTVPAVQLESSQTGRVIEEQSLRQLPLPTRNFQQLLALSPGASASLTNSTNLGRGDATISVNGQRTTSNNIRINGVDANSIGTNSTPNLAVPATDTLQEFIVQTSLYDASNGRNAGGSVEAVTKGGTNNFHGNAYYFYRDDRFNANDFFLNRRGLARPELNRKQFGGQLGGPLVRDKFLFFGAYQGTRERNGASLENSLVTPFLPAGLTDNNRTAAALATTFGIPVASISPVAVNILNARLPGGGFLVPSAPANGLAANSFISTPISSLSTFRENQYTANFDYFASQKHTITAKNFFAKNPTFQANYSFAGLTNGSTQLPGTGGDLDVVQTLLAVTDTYAFSSNLVNQARVGYSRLRVTSQPQEPFTAQSLGITNPLANLFPGMPTITVAGAFTAGSSTFAEQSSRVNGFNFQDTVSLVKGNHRLRMGGEYRYSQVNFFFNAFTRGQLIFSPNATGTAFQNFLIGNGLSIIGSGVYDRAFRINDFSGFVQDDWKVNERLTLNLGLRYDLLGLPRDARNRLVNFLPDQFLAGTAASPSRGANGFVHAGDPALSALGVPNATNETLVKEDANNFAPRVGFAYRVNKSGTMALRGGYGIYYDRISTRYANLQLLNYPYLALAVGVVSPTVFPGLRQFNSPFVPVPQPNTFPVNPTIPSPLNPLTPLVGVPISGIYINPDLATPYIQQYNLTMQWELAKNYLLEVGYVGNKGTKLFQVLTLNQPVYSAATNSFTAPLTTALSVQKNSAGGIQQAQTSSNASYNSLQASLTKRFSNHLQFLASYTFGKSIDYYSGQAISDVDSVPGDQRDWRTNRGRSAFDRKHRFVTSFLYEIPNLVNESSGARFLLNGWQLNGIYIHQSGLPFSIVDAPNNNIIQRANFARSFSGSILTSGSTQDRLNAYFNPAAFALSRPRADGTSVGVVNTTTFDPNAPFGNVGRNAFTGPGQRNFDFSVVKLLRFSERYRAEFRSEFFNIFNWANFANPQNNAAFGAAGGFGAITSSSAGPRIIQFAAKFSF